ncbi:MAG: ABC transporter permease [Candidatus Latescibacterota bacterium]|nr:MAG: ABC transporter permease [Candidatus Latescibacterota bacterium]
MLKYVLKRILAVVPLVLLVTALCFALMHVIPGGPEGVLASNPKIKPDDLARIRSNFGLDRPLVVQYGLWLERVVFHGDFGLSYVTGEPVSEMIGKRLPATLELMGSAFLLSLLVALAVGVVSVLKNNTAIDSLFTVGSLAVISIPVFWLALMSMMLFSVRLGVLPSAGMFTVGTPFSIVDHLRHLVLPTLVLSLVLVASWSRYARETLLEAMSADHIDVARAKGLPGTIVVLRHALRNAAGPIVTVVAMSIPILFTGSVVVETVFSWPGMGRLFYEGLLRHDYTRLMGIVFVSSILVALFNLLADCLYGILDPRIRYAR